MGRPFGMSEEDYEDARSEFAPEMARASAERRETRCSCGPRSEGPCAGCERRDEIAEREAERHADDEAANAVGGSFVRCEDCEAPFAPHDTLNGLCASCAKDRDDRRQSAEEYISRLPGQAAKTVQESLGLSDDEIPF